MPESIQCRFVYVDPVQRQIENITTEFFRFYPEEDGFDWDPQSAKPGGVRITPAVLRDILSQHAVRYDSDVFYQPKRAMVFEVGLDDVQIEKFAGLEMADPVQSQHTWKQFVREFSIDMSPTAAQPLPELQFRRSLTMFHPFLSLTVLYHRPVQSPPTPSPPAGSSFLLENTGQQTYAQQVGGVQATVVDTDDDDNDEQSFCEDDNDTYQSEDDSEAQEPEEKDEEQEPDEEDEENEEDKEKDEGPEDGTEERETEQVAKEEGEDLQHENKEDDGRPSTEEERVNEDKHLPRLGLTRKMSVGEKQGDGGMADRTRTILKTSSGDSTRPKIHRRTKKRVRFHF